MPTPIITEEETFLVGQELVVESQASNGRWGVIFEDDGVQGMLHMLDSSLTESPLLETLTIYYVEGVDKPDQDVELQIAWSEKEDAVVLVLNDYPHAVVDFSKQQACCRLNRAVSYNNWNVDYRWDDQLLQPFTS
ncbi:DUF2251 domain-containing protein [Pelagibaculum spongiae]|uniref:DUF2251 domain-containing protein n=1 Tax=Pelagibaculum spongiae TaxID=2080658 RepID=A0A2V1GW69_9GAMM|nr:DUF2251 domain-containing protein [Pelagibaculum spongiae]PVZ62958.1 DUF2251 domain-containing protein [Pelagibaculum spongiae]